MTFPCKEDFCAWHCLPPEHASSTPRYLKAISLRQSSHEKQAANFLEAISLSVIMKCLIISSCNYLTFYTAVNMGEAK